MAKDKSRIGEKNVNNKGQEMVIIALGPSDTVVVQFENGATKDNVKYKHFCNGAVRMPVLDHLGNEYPSRAAMCEHYGISDNLFKKRIKYGWSLEEALSAPTKQNKELTDHKGTEHDSLRKTAKAYGLAEKTLRRRLKNNWSVEESLTIAPDKGNRIKKIRANGENGQTENKEGSK